MKKIILASVGLILCAQVVAQGYKIGAKVSDFNLRNVDEDIISLSSLEGNKGAIIIFTCNHCPFSQVYEQRIIDLDNKYRELGYPVIAINPNDPAIQPEDSFEEMQRIAKDKSYPFPYTIDETQEVAKAYGATRTPHVFVVEKVGKKGKYHLRYIGAIDDNAESGEKAQEHYVQMAVDALLAGKAVEKQEVKAVGCTIKWRKK